MKEKCVGGAVGGAYLRLRLLFILQEEKTKKEREIKYIKYIMREALVEKNSNLCPALQVDHQASALYLVTFSDNFVL